MTEFLDEIAETAADIAMDEKGGCRKVAILLCVIVLLVILATKC
jgi:hypothetical protein